MTRLSLIETEAHQLVRRLPESRRLTQQAALVELCETHWRSIRGPQPDTPLAQSLCTVTPPLADLLMKIKEDGGIKL